MRLSLLAIVALTACASGTGKPALDEFPPGVTGGAEVTYYDIQGSTAPQLVAEMRRLGPQSGQYFGETQSPLRWSWRTKSNAVNCTLTAVSVRMRSDVTLPRWTPPKDTLPGLVAQWNQFIAGLETHEVGHKDIAARGAKDILHKLQTLSAPCATMSEEAKRVTADIVARMRVEQIAYDTDTRHGATQGATFPGRRPNPIANTP
jgi:predicted secreted Zn-dependent protease